MHRIATHTARRPSGSPVRDDATARRPEAHSGLNPRRAGRFGLALLAGVIGLTISACGEDASGQSDREGFQRVVNVEVQSIQPTTFTEVIRLTGTAGANRDVTISAEESGVVREIMVDEGSRVSAGQAIARIDDRVLRAQTDQARAQSELARETWERRKRLYEEDQVGSELAYLEARYNAEQSRANLSALEERLDRTVIRAPIGGILDSRNFEVGTMVSAGSEMARIVDLDPVKVRGGVPERFAADVLRGARATVSFDVLRGESFPGQITYVGSAVDRRSRTFPAELTMPNPGGVIKPEMVATIEIVKRALEDVLVIPQEAMVRVEEGFVAFVVEEENGRDVARVRPLTLGATQRNRVVVEAGLEPGDRLVVVGQQQVAAGDRVQVVGERTGGMDR